MLTVAWPLALFSFLLGFSPTIEAELYEWLLMFSTFIRTRFFIFYMLIEPPNQTFTEFYMNQNFMVSCLGAVSNLVYYIAHNLHPSRIVMPLSFFCCTVYYSTTATCILQCNRPNKLPPNQFLAAIIQWTAVLVYQPPTWSSPV